MFEAHFEIQPREPIYANFELQPRDIIQCNFGLNIVNGIISIEKTSTEGLVDTYTITLKDGTTYTFTVTNGRGITNVTAHRDGIEVTYTIYFSDGTTYEFIVKDGDSGVRIQDTPPTEENVYVWINPNGTRTAIEDLSTIEQLNAINSGINQNLVSQITVNKEDIEDIKEAGYITIDDVGDGVLTIQKNGQSIGTFSANQKTNSIINIEADSPVWGNIAGNIQDQIDLQQQFSTKQNTINDLSIIRSNAQAGKSASDTISTYGNIVTHNADEFATSSQGAKADSALQPNDNISELVNDSGYITGISGSDVVNALGYTPVDNTITINNKQLNEDITLTYSDVNALSDETFIPNVINNVISTDTSNALSANMGKELNDRIKNLESLGRYLSEWDCTTGLALTDPTYSPYPYRTGDYFLVLTVAEEGGINYRPSGSEYIIGQASTVVETHSIAVGSRYIYDGTVWILQSSAQQTVSFANIAGQPTDNTNLAGALNNKYDASNPNGFISGITGTMVTNALGYTPYNSTNPNNYISRTGISSTTPINYNSSTGVISVASDYQIPSTSQITTWNNKQDQLVSGTNIKTINNNSLLGSGNISINEITSAERTKLGTINTVFTKIGSSDIDYNLSTIECSKESQTYGFTYGTYTYGSSSFTGLGSQNYHVGNSFAYGKITFNFPANGILKVTAYCDGESTYDFGIISNLDQELSKNATADSTNKYSFSGHQKTYYTAEYDVTAGSHFITFKYKKDSSVDTDLDRMVITKIEFKSQSGWFVSSYENPSELIEIGNTPEVPVEDVQMQKSYSATTYSTILEGKIAKIPKATTSVMGVVQPSTSYGTTITNGYLSIYSATSSQVQSKSSSNLPLTPARVNDIIKYGLGNYNGTAFTDAEKQKARETIGADEAGTKITFVEWS